MKKSELRQIIKEEIDKTLNNVVYNPDDVVYNPDDESSISIFEDYKGNKNKKNKKGMADGVWEEKNDRISTKTIYKDGVEDGPKEVYKDNKLYARGMMKNDKMVGKWQEFNNGKFKKFETY